MCDRLWEEPSQAQWSCLECCVLTGWMHASAWAWHGRCGSRHPRPYSECEERALRLRPLCPNKQVSARQESRGRKGRRVGVRIDRMKEMQLYISANGADKSPMATGHDGLGRAQAHGACYGHVLCNLDCRWRQCSESGTEAGRRQALLHSGTKELSSKGWRTKRAIGRKTPHQEPLAASMSDAIS